MIENQANLLRTAGDSLSAARLFLDGGRSALAVSRACYAMFSIAEPFLEGEAMSERQIGPIPNADKGAL